VAHAARGRGVALLTLQTSPEHWRRFTTHFDSEGTAAPLRTLTKLGDSESKMSGLVDVGLVIDLDRSRPGAIALLNTWDEHYRNPARRYSVASLAALQVPRSKMELYDVTAPASSPLKLPLDLPDLTDGLVRISASQAIFENRIVTVIDRKLDTTIAQRLHGHPHALRVLGYAPADDGTRWLVTERVDVWACDTTEGDVSGEERLRMLMHVAAAWEELTEAGQRPPPRELDSSMVARVGSVWKLAPFEGFRRASGCRACRAGRLARLLTPRLPATFRGVRTRSRHGRRAHLPCKPHPAAAQRGGPDGAWTKRWSAQAA
jgi:hypothetical protein